MYQPQIVQVKPTKDYVVYIYYDDGNVRLYDAKPLIDEKGIFEKLKDINIFLNTCTIMNNTLAWDVAGNYDEYHCIDICPDALLECPIVDEISIVEEELFV